MPIPHNITPPRPTTLAAIKTIVSLHYPVHEQREILTLAAHVLHIPHHRFYSHPETVVAKHDAKKCFAALVRFSAGEPIAYIVGAADFYGLSFTVTPDVLIPRADTEVLIDCVRDHCAHLSAPRIIELGTGSGAVAVTLKKQLPKARICATDIAPATLMIAKQNSIRHDCTDIDFLQSDWLAAIDTRNACDKYDVICANPPYIDVNDPAVAASVRTFEPHTALFAEDNGLAAIHTIIRDAPHALAPNGLLALEHGYRQATAVHDAMHNAGFSEIRSLRDTGGHLRVTCGRLPYK